MPRTPSNSPTWHDPPGPDTITLKLKLITPMFGGGYEPREVDPLLPIRPSAIRGHLRFWWRATAGAQYASAANLFNAEKVLWGSMDEPGSVKIAVEVQAQPTIEDTDISMQAPDAYALWPARATRPPNPQAAAQRVKQGLSFRLRLDYPAALEQDVTNALKAWVMFGGIGGRTRRGCGALTITSAFHNGGPEQLDQWLPANTSLTRDGMGRLLPVLLGAAPNAGARQVPGLSGASLYVGQPRDALPAWHEALKWLREFRQGSSYEAGERAREPGPPGGGNRPSRSNWPEADKVRHILGKPQHLRWAYPPRHNATPAWPRAGFGLPIIGQFQQRSRTGQRWQDLGEFEPRGFEIIWHDQSGKERERLASPLIIKPLALVNGQCVPCALWLNRAYPQGEACLRGRPDTGAPFDRLVAEGDTAFYRPLAQPDLRSAFFGWVQAHFNTAKKVLP